MYYFKEETDKQYKAIKFSAMQKQARERLNKVRELKKSKKSKAQ